VWAKLSRVDFTQAMAKIAKNKTKRPRADKHKGKKHNQRALGVCLLPSAAFACHMSVRAELEEKHTQGL